MKVQPVLIVALLLAAGFHGSSASAFSVFPFDDAGQTRYLKWGDNSAGTPGGVVSWSFIPAGTSGSASYCGNSCPGTSLSSINILNQSTGMFESTPISSLADQVNAALSAWSSVANISFTGPDSDSGAAINDSGAVPPATGQIRIGVFAFSSGGGAVGFAPPPNGGTGAGDVIFDANSFYQFAPGNEGDMYDPTFAPNDFETLLLHELGHAIGLAHPPFDGSCPVMQVDSACFPFINRQLDPDDIAGAQFLYGVNVPLPPVALLFPFGLVAGWAWMRRGPGFNG